MVPAEEAVEDAVGASLRQLRPQGTDARSLEQRLAIASILAGAGAETRAQLGRLAIQRRIGGGGMGVVYRAFDPNLGRLVAVKLLRASVQRQQRDLIAAEARALAQVSHPNVVTVYEIVDHDDDLYFVMEYVPGVTLRAWLDAHPNARWREIVEWFVQAGRGIAAAHDKRVVHHDFKPENVLVGEDGRVRVADFGLAVLDVEGGATGPRGGTARYMAPEVFCGMEATAASDQFSFARALLDALEGRETPDVVRGAAERGLADDQTRRHRTMGEFVTVLEGALHAGRQRSRTLLLERVERLWLRGVLDRSLAQTGAVELELTPAPELVAPPWDEWETGRDASSASSPSPRSTSILDVFRDSHEALLIVGAPGAGKTTLLLRLCRELFHASSIDPDAPAPVVLGLSTYHPRALPRAATGTARDRRARPSAASQHFTAWIVDELVGKYGLPRRGVTRWLEEGQIAVLLDGLDETESALRDEVVEALNAFRREHPVPIVVSCRDSEYAAIGTRLELGGAVRVGPLDDASLLQLVEAYAAPQLEARLARDPELREMLRNPLLLTLHARSEDGATLTPGDAAARGWERAYERFVDHAFEKSSDAERARLEAQLAYLARAMRRQSVTELWLERLDFGWLESRWERDVGYAIGVVAVLAVGLGVNVASVALGNPVPSALTFGAAVTVGSFAYTRGRIEPVDRLRWSFRRALRLFPLTMACATVVGLAEGLQVNFWKNMAGAWLTGAVLTLAFALEASDEATAVRPNAGVRRSLRYAFGVSLGFGLATLVAFRFVFEPFILGPLREVPEHTGDPRIVAPVAVGLFVFTALFLVYGGFAVLMHGALRLWLALRSPFGFSLEAPLGRAAALGLVRQVGGGYVFLHRTLLDHFASARAVPDRSRSD